MKTVAELLQGRYRLIEVDHEQPVLVAATRMADENIGAVLVTRAERVVGIVTERDVVQRVVAKGLSSAETLLGAVMTAPVLSVDLETSLDSCAAVMADEGMRHLLVREGAKAVAVISARDLLHAKSEQQQDHIQRLEEYLYQYA